MNHLNIHYVPATGQITCWDNGWREEGDTLSFRADSVVVTLFFDDETPHINPEYHKIDVGTKTFVLKSEAEIACQLLPTGDEVAQAIYCELCATDDFVDAPSDRPRKGALLFDWKPYRQALRNLSKLPTPAEMVTTWPLRPDGADAAIALRTRLPKR
jgi:hypothetical protein